jgi:hypothetical protein
VSIDSGKYRLCFRLSVFVASLLGASLSFMAVAAPAPSQTGV